LDLGTLQGNEHLAEDLLRGRAINVVYCAGAMTYVDGCESNRELAFATNCYGPGTLAGVSSKLGVRFVYFSTDYIYDGTSGPYSERDPGNPINIYGKSKWMGEQVVLKACPEALIVRTTGVYGADPRGKNFLYSLRDGIAEGQTVRVPFDQISTPTYNVDLAKAVIALVEENTSGVFNITGPDLVSRFEFARRAARVMGLNELQIVGISTTELKQIAQRPLLAGLRNDKVVNTLATVNLRSIEAAVSNWMSAT